MAGPIGDAFVRIRPDTATFRAETAAGIRSGLVGAAKLAGGIFAIKGATDFVKTVSSAAATEQAELATVRKSIENTDNAWRLHGTTVGNVLLKQARDLGFSTETISDSFLRIEAGTRNTAKSLKTLALAEDVARGRHIDLAQASIVLSRVQQGSETALRRLGIIIPKVTTAQDALKREYAQGIATGAKFTDAQKEQYRISLAQAKAADAQASKTKVLDEVQRRFGGQASTFATQASGGFERLRENIRQFEATLGQDAIPTLNAGVAGLIRYVNELRTSEGVHHAASAAVQGFASIVRSGVRAIEFLSPALHVAVDLVERFGKATGVGGLVALVGGFKAVGVAVEVVRGVQAKYQAILAAGQGEQAATAAGAEREAAAYGALTAAIEQNTLALTANLGASERGALALSGGLGNTAANVAQTYGSLGQTVTTETAAITRSVNGVAASAEAAGQSLLDTAANTGQVLTSLETSGERVSQAATATASLSKEVDGLAAAQGRLEGAAGGAQGQQAAITTGARTEATAVAGLTREVEGNTGALAANAAAGERSATVLGAGVTRSAAGAKLALAGVSTTLAASGAETAIFAEQIANSSGQAGDGLLGLANASSSVADHTLGLATRFRLAGAETLRTSTQLAGLTSEQLRYVAALERSLGPEAAAQAAITAQAGAYDGLAVSAGGAAAAVAAAGTASGEAAIVAAGAASKLALAEVELASGARLIVPSAVAAKNGLKVVGEEAAVTGTRAAGLGGKLKTLGSGLFALAGGWVGLAAVAIGAVSFLVFKFLTGQSALERSNQRLGTSLEQLAGDYASAARAAKAYGDATSSLKTDRIAVGQARLSLEQARSALAALDAKKGTDAYTEALLRTQQAVDQYRLAVRQQANDERTQTQAQRERANAIRKSQSDARDAIQKTLEVLHHAEHDTTGFLGKIRDFVHQDFLGLPAANPLSSLIDATGPKPGQLEAMDRFSHSLSEQAAKLRDSHPFFARQLEDFSLLTKALGAVPPDKVIRVFLQTGSARTAVRELIGLLDRSGVSLAQFVAKIRAEGEAIRSTDPALSRRILLLGEFAQVIGTVPKERTTNLILRAAGFKGAVTAALLELDRIKGIKPGTKAAAEFAAAFIARLKNAGLVNSLKDALGSVTSAVAGVEEVTFGQVRAAQAAANQARRNVAAIGSQLRDQTQAVVQAARQVADAQRSLADAITSGNQQIHDSVVSASQNLFSIGESLSSSIDQFLDAQKQSAAALSEGSPAAKEFRKLTDRIKKGEGGPEVERTARALEARLEAESTAQHTDLEKRKQLVHQHVADLVDQFNKGIISVAEFNKRLAKILASQGISYRAAGRVLGIAFADSFKAQVEGIEKQAAAIAAGPRPKGVTGLEPDIIRPLEAVKQAQREIRDAQRHLADAQREEGKSQRELSSIQAKAAKLTANLNAATSRLADLQTRYHNLVIKQAELEVKARQRATELAHEAISEHSFGQNVAQVGADVGSGVTKGLKSAKASAIAAMVGLIDAVISAARKKAKAKSPSEETAALGEDMARGISAGLIRSRSQTARAAEDLVEATLRQAQRAAHTIKFDVKADISPAKAAIEAMLADEQEQQLRITPAQAAQVVAPPKPVVEHPVGTQAAGAVAGALAPEHPVFGAGLFEPLELLQQSREQTRLQRLSERHLSVIEGESRKQTEELRRIGTTRPRGPKVEELKGRGLAAKRAALAAASGVQL